MNVVMNSSSLLAAPPALSALDVLAESQPGLAARFREGWRVPAGAWAATQWACPPDPGLEPAFRAALVAELAERAEAGPPAEHVVAAVEAGGAVLTPHHVCPTPGPTFGAIDWLATQATTGPVLVLAWSGLPMSNSACSGALCFRDTPLEALLQDGPELHRQRKAARDRARDGVVTEQRITVVPARSRDALVFEHPESDRLHEVFATATDELQQVLPAPRAGEGYALWAVRAAQALQRRVLGRDDVYYVDLNRVGRRYLLGVLDEPEHPVTRLLTDPALAEAVAAELPGLSWFYARRPGKKEKVVTLGPPGAEASALREGLASGALCPGLVPVFGALRLRSRIQILGGFRQVGYLEDIAAAWRAHGLASEDRGVPGGLVTGRWMAEGAPAYPLDVALGTVRASGLPTAATPMSVLWEPLLSRVQQTT